MADRLLWFRAVLAAARVHQEHGHVGAWRDCDSPLCREAQQFIGPSPAGLDRDLTATSVVPSARRLARLDDPEDRRLLGLPRGVD